MKWKDAAKVRFTNVSVSAQVRRTDAYVYVHEGVDTSQKRYRLKNPHSLPDLAIEGNRDDLWEHVVDYIVKQYDLDSLKKFFSPAMARNG